MESALCSCFLQFLVHFRENMGGCCARMKLLRSSSIPLQIVPRFSFRLWRCAPELISPWMHVSWNDWVQVSQSMVVDISLSWNVIPVVARCFRYRYGQGFNDRPFNLCLLRFHKIPVIDPKWKVPFVKCTYFLEQTRSVISNSFISFFKQILLPWHVPYIFMTPLLISQAIFFFFRSTCLFLKFRNSSDVA